MNISFPWRRASAATPAVPQPGTAVCVIDPAAVISARRETKVLVLVYGVIITLVALHVAPLTASGIAISVGVALYAAMAKSA